MLRGRGILTLAELSGAELLRVLDVAGSVKAEARLGLRRPLLPGRCMAMVFERPSTRTRVSLAVAMSQLGGSAISLSPQEMQLSRGETVEDTARALSGYVDIVAARVQSHDALRRFAAAASIPVVNALSDLYHPTQILADLQTVRERKRRLEGLKLAYVGDGNNVCNTLLVGCPKLGLGISVATPQGYTPLKEALQAAEASAKEMEARVELTRDPHEAVKGADVVYTDVFVSAGQEAERERRLRAFLPRYRVDGALLGLAKEDAIVMHCLPARRGEEITDEVLDGPKSVVWDQAENRLHTAKALLTMLLLEEEEIPW